MQVQAYEAEDFEGLKEARDDIAMRTTFSSVYNVLQFLNSMFGLVYAERIDLLKQRADEIPVVED